MSTALEVCGPVAGKLVAAVPAACCYEEAV